MCIQTGQAWISYLSLKMSLISEYDDVISLKPVRSSENDWQIKHKCYLIKNLFWWNSPFWLKDNSCHDVSIERSAFV